jgi:NAD(P)-dependent dehydrogenase (short-subunit alcohol dehydrogenase family)
MELCDRGYIKIVHCDLSIISSVKQCVQQLLECYTQIDILVNNAGKCSFQLKNEISRIENKHPDFGSGIKNCPEMKSEDGYDLQFHTNYLGHFQLTTGIVPLMTTSALNGFQPRLVSYHPSSIEI